MFKSKRKLILVLVIILSLGLIIVGKFQLQAILNIAENTAPAKPLIEKVDIQTTLPDTQITIHGHNFALNSGDNQIRINNLNLPVITALENILTTKLDPKAFSGPLIVTSKGQPSQPYPIELPTPIINYLEFPFGLFPDKEIKIHGQNFDQNLNSLEITFGATKLTAQNSTPEILSVLLPHESTTGNLIIKKNGFISNEIPLDLKVIPIITGLYIKQGTIGEEVVITGKNFNSDKAKNSIKFNNLSAATTESINNTQLKTKIPPLASSGYLTVMVNSYTSNPFPYTLNPGPQISLGNIEKNTTSSGQTATLTLYSQDLTSGDVKIYLNDTELVINNKFLNQIKILLPGSLPPKGNIYARRNGQKGNEVIFDFAEILGPKISQISTAKGFYPTQSITISGANFPANLGPKTIGGLVINSSNESNIQAAIPVETAHGTTISVTLNNWGFSSNNISFLVGDDREVIYPNPEITELVFPQGQHPNDPVTIKGFGFSSNIEENTVMFGTITGKITNAYSDFIDTKIPAKATSGPIQITSFKTNKSAGFNLVVIPTGDTQKTINFTPSPALDLKPGQTDLVLATMGVINHDRTLLAKTMSFVITTKNPDNFLAFKNIKLVIDGVAINATPQIIDSQNNQFRVSFQNIKIPVALEGKIWYLKSDILPFIEPRVDYELNLNPTSEKDLQLVYEASNQPATIGQTPLTIKNSIENSPIICLSRPEKNYCQPEVKEIKEVATLVPPAALNSGQTATSGQTAPVTPLPPKPIEKVALEALPFADVASGLWFNVPVAFLKAKKIVTGFQDGTFKPNKPVTRAEFLKMTLMAANLIPQAKEAKNNSFTDIDGHWAAIYINLAATKKIIDGSKTQFAPNREITRAEAIKILMTAFNISLTTPDNFHFTDTQTHWCKIYCDQAKINNLVTGYEVAGQGWYFYPDRLLNRAEASQLIYKKLTEPLSS